MIIIMSIEDFYKRNNGKYSINLIKKWLNKGYIRGAYIDSKESVWYIPEQAMPPYTKNGKPHEYTSIYKSIIKGVMQNFDVFGKLYNIPDFRFNIYIEQLKKGGYIDTFESEGVIYCISTPKSEKFLQLRNSKIREIYKDTISSVTEGIVKGLR